MAKHLTRKEKIALTKLVARGWTYAAAGAQFGRSRHTAHDIFWSHAKYIFYPWDLYSDYKVKNGKETFKKMRPLEVLRRVNAEMEGILAPLKNQTKRKFLNRK